jgi:hypothetical protein
VRSQIMNSKDKTFSARAIGSRTAVRALLATGLLTIASFAFLSAPASAIYNHKAVELSFPVGPECSNYENSIYDLAVDETHNWIYVGCANDIRRFDLNGNPVNFSAVEPYLEENKITYDPGGEEEQFAGRPNLAVDNSGSINQGRLFVTSSPNIDIFNPSGEYFTPIIQPLESTISNSLEALDVGPDGSIYVGSERPGGRVSKYNPALQEVKRFYSNGGGGEAFETNEPCDLGIDTTGALWLDTCFSFFNSGRALHKYEVDQFTTELSLTPFGTTPAQLAPFVGKPSPYMATNPVTTDIGEIDVDLNTNDVYVNQRNRIDVFSQGTPEDPVYQDAPSFGSPDIGSESFSIAVTKDNHVFASKGNTTIVKFGPGDVLPNLHTYAANINEVGHTDATVKGRVERDTPNSGSPIVSCKFQFGFNTSYSGGGSGTAPCVPAPAPKFEAPSTEVEATLPLPSTGSTYHYRLTATNEKGENFGIDRTVVPAYVLKLQTLPAEEIDTDGAVLKGSFDPDNIETKYFFEYGVNTSYGLKTPLTVGGTAAGITEVGAELTGLPSGKVFNYRIVAKNVNGTTIGANRTFRTGSTPDISGVRATEVAETSATLKAAVNPVGFESKYKFEYGSSPEYGQSAPASLTPIGSGGEPVSVSQPITGLQAGVTYHFRVVAENKWGTSFSPDTTFDFAPPACPNDHVRQQSGASYLPDCRAYELVSPGASGAILLWPSNVVATGGEGLEVPCCGNNVYNRGINYMENRGFATSPSRFSFYGGVGTITGLYSPTSLEDQYMSTRTPTGWVTTLPGLNGNEAFQTARKECSESMALCTDHSESEEFGLEQEYAPYLFTAAGERLGRLPTNVNVIPEGTKFRGWQRMSGDFSHFVFSSSEYLGGSFFEPKEFPGIPFAPGASTSGVGSAYDNDIADRTVQIISKLPNGENIPTKVPPVNGNKAIGFPGLSPNGSHVLMETYGGPHLRYLYMSVNDGPVMLIGIEEKLHPEEEEEIQRPVEPIGMNRSGSTVLFASTAKLTLDDEDTSRDIYSWSEATGKLTRLSQGSNRLNLVQKIVLSGVTGGTFKLKLGGQTTADIPANATSSELQAALLPLSNVDPGDVTVAGEAGGPYTVTFAGQYAEEVEPLVADGTELEGAGAKVTVANTGDMDECSASWTSGCNAQIVTPERAHPNNNEGTSVPTAMDDQFAENTGDVFFFSPELLDPDKPGIANQKNLYDYHNGAVQLVATLDPGTDINRLQISPDGRHAAFLTKSNLTSYDSKGFREMYTYDTATGQIECASCNRNGLPPTGDARASASGRFMADDGRAFFSTFDALVPRDQDGKISDVYEYVAGRPQLITSGLGARDFTGGSSVISLFATPEYTGLEAVSHDGTDVYFSTFETLVGRDHNGEFVKFYDARTGGGFDESPALGPCAAADECHGVDSTPPPPATIASGGNAPGGNVTNQKKKKKHRHKKTKRHHTRHNHG